MIGSIPSNGTVHGSTCGIVLLICGILLLMTPVCAAGATKPRSGAFSILPSNPYFFQDANGKPVVLVGDYTWGTFSDIDFDYVRFLDSLKSRGLNVARVWLWWGCEEFPLEELGNRHIEPYLRTGPGVANDGGPKYDLTKFNPAFFDRLRAFCQTAKQRGIEIQLMMMDAWMIKSDKLWRLNAYQRDNNINGVDGDPANTGVGTDGKRGFCSMGNPKVMEFQKAYIRKVVDTVNGFDNIHYEIANENYYSEEWELALCDFIKEYEKSKPKQHLTMRRDLPSHSYVVQKWDPAIVHKGIMEKRSLRQPLIFDTDWTINNNDDEVRKAMWAALASNGHFDYMDDNSLAFRLNKPYNDKRAKLHKQIDYAAAFMKQIKPWEMTPSDALVKSGTAFAMASETELAAYLPSGGRVTLDLSSMRGPLKARWYNPLDGKFGKPVAVRAGTTVELTAPDSSDWALLIE